MSEFNNAMYEEITTSNIFIVNDYAGRAITSDNVHGGQSTLSASAIDVTIPENRSIQSIQRRRKNNRQQPLIDVVVLLVSLPCLMIFGLLLEANTRGNWQQNSDSWFTVLGLGIGLALVALAICGYVTHRMGVCINCLWAGPQHDDVDQESYYNPHVNINELIDSLPPSYEKALGLDLPPPPYSEIIIIDPNDEKRYKFTKDFVIQHM
ncbi:unnamed protein product [Diamesa hyperborea]